MLRPTLFLCFGVALFLALGPAPSEQCSKRGKCHICGRNVFFEGDPFLTSLFGTRRQSRQFEEQVKLQTAFNTPCNGGTGTVVDCASIGKDAMPSGFQWTCAKIVTKSGEVGRMCGVVKTDAELKCIKTEKESEFCRCSSYFGLCNSSPSLRQRKYGPLSAVGLALVVAYFGFNFTLAHRI